MHLPRSHLQPEQRPQAPETPPDEPGGIGELTQEDKAEEDPSDSPPPDG